MKPRIVIVVRGGCVVSVHSVNGWEICEIIDVDNLHETASNEAIHQIITEATQDLKPIY